MYTYARHIVLTYYLLFLFLFIYLFIIFLFICHYTLHLSSEKAERDLDETLNFRIFTPREDDVMVYINNQIQKKKLFQCSLFFKILLIISKIML